MCTHAVPLSTHLDSVQVADAPVLQPGLAAQVNAVDGAASRIQQLSLDSICDDNHQQQQQQQQQQQGMGSAGCCVCRYDSRWGSQRGSAAEHVQHLWQTQGTQPQQNTQILQGGRVGRPDLIAKVTTSAAVAAVLEALKLGRRSGWLGLDTTACPQSTPSKYTHKYTPIHPYPRPHVGAPHPFPKPPPPPVTPLSVLNSGLPVPFGNS
jgi:hypothetical protein